MTDSKAATIIETLARTMLEAAGYTVREFRTVEETPSQSSRALIAVGSFGHRDPDVRAHYSHILIDGSSIGGVEIGPIS